MITIQGCRLAGLLTALLLCNEASCDPYQALVGHQVWKIEGLAAPVSSKLLEEGLVDVFDISGSMNTIRIQPSLTDEVRRRLLQNSLTYKTLVPDLGTYLKDNEHKRIKRQTQICTATSCPTPKTDSYMSLEEIEWYLKELNTTHSSRVSVTSIGKSFEGRDIWQVHIKPLRCGNGAAVWFEGGLHAREWISPAVTLNLIDGFVNQCSIGNRLDLYVVPMANPDGYRYSWTNDRFWRKNRRINKGSNCDGVDLNRNWDYKYGVGASKNPCSEIFQGQSAFSEPETTALKNAMERVNNEKNLLMAMAIHSFGQLLYYPYGWTTDPAPFSSQLVKKGEIFANAVKKTSGKTFQVINSGSLGFVSGGMDDWAKGVLGVDYSYTLELRDEGKEGFKLGEEEIAPSVEETWNGMQALLIAIRPGNYLLL